MYLDREPEDSNHVYMCLPAAKHKKKKPRICGFPISHPCNSCTFFFTCYIAYINASAIHFIFCPPFALQRSNKNHRLLWIRIYPYALILLLNFHFFLSFVRRFSCILILHLSFFLFQLNLLLIKKKKKFFI